jgi:TP901 family phage tail tape measure protein
MATQPLRVKINGDASGLNKAVSSASSKLKSFGGKLKGLGSSLQAVALPMALLGGASIKMGLDFDKSMTKIKSLVGVASDEVNKMGESARKMALATGISSSEAADALFFITSAGLRGADAMATLDIAAKAAASGLGETKTIADLTTSAMNAYGKEALNSEAATDVLTAAVREGKLESSELAGAMGGVIPIASNMGVSFDQVGAAMAAMSRTGTNAAVGATQLTAILSSLKKPAAEAEQALQAMGLSTDGVQKSLAEDGLMNTLEMLKGKTEEFGVDITSIFPNIRALKGVLDLTGAGMEDAKKIFDSLSKSAGSTAKAFQITQESASFQFQKALNGAKETLASLGQQLLVAVVPLLQKAATFVQNLYQRFNELSPSTKKLLIALGGVAIVLPTIITLAGTLTGILGALLSPIGLVAAGLAGIAYVISQNWNEILPVVVGLYNQFVDLYNSSKLIRTGIAAIGSVFKSVFIAAKASVMKFVNVFQTMWKLIKAFSKDGFDASFGDILKEGFAESGKITKDAAEDIATEFTDGYTNALGNELESKTVEQVQSGLNNAAGRLKSFVNNFTSDLFSGGSGAATNLAPSDSTTQEDKPTLLDQTLGTPEETDEKISGFVTKMQNLGLSIDGIMSEVGNSFMSAFSAVMEGENFVKALGQMLGQIIKKLIAAAMAALALSVILGGLGIGSFQGGGTGVKDIFGKLSGFGAFANGGIVSAPTMGLVGEYPGARSNPEVIAPLSKLKGMLGNNNNPSNVQVGGSFELRGQDLIVALERANSTRNRII